MKRAASVDIVFGDKKKRLTERERLNLQKFEFEREKDQFIKLRNEWYIKKEKLVESEKCLREKQTLIDEEISKLSQEEVTLREQSEKLNAWRIELDKYKIELDNLEERLTQQGADIQVRLNSQRDKSIPEEKLNNEIERFDRCDFMSINSASNMTQPNIIISYLADFQVGEDWDLYAERLDQFFVANNIPEPRWVAVLITKLGAEAYKILRDLCDPDTPKTKTFDELCTILKGQFAPKISAFKERVEFYNLRQNDNEVISEWFARIKSKAIHCKFGANLDDKIKDKFVTGLVGGPIMDKMCELETTTTLLEIVEKAKSKEATLSRSTSLRPAESIHRLQTNYRRNITKTTPNNANQITSRDDTTEPICKYCGKSRHNFSRCRYKSFKCDKCNKIGHLSRVCTAKQKFSTNHFLENNEEDSLNEVINDMFSLSNVDKIVEPEMVEIEIEGKILKVEIDTGASRSVIPELIYKKLFNNCMLEKSSVRLRMYNGEIISPIGQITVKMRNKNLEVDGCLVVVKNGLRPLLGRDLMKPLGFYISSLNYINSNDPIKQLLDNYSELFDGKLGKFKFEKVHIKLKEKVAPIFIKPRPVPFALRNKIDEKLDELEKNGVITLMKNSEWGTPLVPVLKENGDIRVCADYKITINRFVDDDKHPFPRIEELFTKLSGGEMFTKLDLTAAYNQLELTESSRELLAWSTHRGIYYVNRLAFGVKPACAIFQKILEKVLQGSQGATNFLDDIIITGKNCEEHLKNLKDVFRRLHDAGFKLNLKKCEFFKPVIRYLGHIIDKDGLHKDPEKVMAIIKAPRPNNTQEVQAFLGMVNYYGKFMPKLSDILNPLYKLLKLKTFKWEKECEDAFKLIKNEMSSEQFLAHFDPKLPIKIVCDASKYGIGAVLLHVFPDNSEKPICFASRVLKNSEKNYSVIHKEALAIYWGVNKFHQYLLGNKFILCSDHKPLQALFGENKGIPQLAAGRLQRWALFLSGFDYSFQYIKGEKNGGADGLSRLPLNCETKDIETEDYFHFIVEDQIPVSADDLRKEIRKDNILSKVYLYTRDGWPEIIDGEFKSFKSRANEISIDRGILMWGYRAIIPDKFRKQLMDEIHGGHTGMSKMKSLARQYFWWPGLDKEIENFVNNCDTCKSVAKQPEKVPLIKFNEANYVYERIHMDFLGPFKGKMFLVIVDAFSKWPEIFIMGKTDAESTLDKLRECIARFGLPKLIITDNGSQLISDKFEEFCKLNLIKHRTSPPYHPATNGLAENAVGSVKRGIEKLSKMQNRTNDISTLLNRYLFSYRNTPHSTTGETPSKLMFNREIKTRLNFLTKTMTDKMRERQKDYFHGNRNVDFNEDEIVYARDYKNPAKPTWTKSIIKEKLGQYYYNCTPLNNEKLVWKRHANQLLKSGKFYEEQKKQVDNAVHSRCVLNQVNTQIMERGKEDCELVNETERCEQPQLIQSESENSTQNLTVESSYVQTPNSISRDNSNMRVHEVDETAVNEPKGSSIENTLTKLYINRNEGTAQNMTKWNVNERPKRNVKPVNRLNL